MIDLENMSYEEIEELAHRVGNIYWCKRVAKESEEGTGAAKAAKIEELIPVLHSKFQDQLTLGKAIELALTGFIIRDMYLDWDDIVDLIKEMFEVDIESI